eukprot:Partr_v1_DN24497_c0_g1_i2_m66252 putative Charged multivesicular body protein
METMQSNAAMAEAMKGVTKAMKSMNKRINMPAIQKIMMEFEKESEIMDMKEDMMNDAIDDAVEEEEDEEESEAIVQQVLDEIGISFDQSLPATGGAFASKESAAVAGNSGPVAVGEGADDAALQARLDSLRKE